MVGRLALWASVVALTLLRPSTGRQRASALRVGWVLLLLLAAPHDLTAQRRHPQLEIEAMPRLESIAEGLRAYPPWRFDSAMRLVGLGNAGAPIRVVLLSEGSPQAESAPTWVSGYAYGALGTVFLLPERTPTYPDGSLEELLRHEVAHVLVHRAAGGREVPRWFNEGLAMVSAGTWDSGDHSRLAIALLLEARVPLADLDRRFQGESGTVTRAYAVSGAFVRDILRTHGSWVPAQILRGVRTGLSFPEAFRRATGTTLAAAEADFWNRYSLWYRWLPILTSSVTLWLLITALALIAFRRRKRLDAELAERWEEAAVVPEATAGTAERDDAGNSESGWS